MHDKIAIVVKDIFVGYKGFFDSIWEDKSGNPKGWEEASLEGLDVNNPVLSIQIMEGLSFLWIQVT